MSKLISKNSILRFKQGGSNSANRVYTEIYDTDTGVTRKGYTMDGEFYEFSDEALRLMLNSNKKENPSTRKKSSTKRPISKFAKAFNEARARGDAFFTFGGKDYSTQKKGEVMDESKWGTEAYRSWKTPVIETAVEAYRSWKTPVIETAVTETPVIETLTINKPITNNPGYYAIPVDYDNAENFNLLGIKDYNTLKLFVIDNPRHQFSLDMIRRFKDTDLWTLNDIESALKVKGKYRNGYLGDLYDIRKSMKDYIQNNPRPLLYIDINDYMTGLETRFPFLKKQFKNGGQIFKFLEGSKFKIVGYDENGIPMYLAVDALQLAAIENLAKNEVNAYINSLRNTQPEIIPDNTVDIINTWKGIIPTILKNSNRLKNNSSKKTNSKPFKSLKNKLSKKNNSTQESSNVLNSFSQPDVLNSFPQPKVTNTSLRTLNTLNTPFVNTRTYIQASPYWNIARNPRFASEARVHDTPIYTNGQVKYFYKQGGQLVSRNPVKRFKNK